MRFEDVAGLMVHEAMTHAEPEHTGGIRYKRRGARDVA
jgi:hypothetical protein